MRVKLRMEGFNASWSRWTSSHVLGFCWRESNARMGLTCGMMPGWPTCKGTDVPGMALGATGALATWEGCCCMLL